MSTNEKSKSAAGRRELILVVHQSAELYGSDRSLLEVLSGIDRTRYECVVCIPEEGPLGAALKEQGFEVHALQLVKVGRAMFSPHGMLALPGQILAAFRGINAVLAQRPVSIVYTNTLAVLAGAFWALLNRRPHVWHVREIIRRPAFVSSGFRFLAQRLSRQLICNSRGTRNWVDEGIDPSRSKSVVVWNGVESGASPADPVMRPQARVRLGLQQDLPLVLMVGRVNKWKGQDLLIEAIDELAKRGVSAFQMAIVGGPPPGQEHYMTDLKARVANSPAASRIQVVAFTEGVQDYYAAADVCVVPSREPEPFGRVAIEAMAAGVPVIAADHGGLSEIVASGDSGLLFKPNDMGELADALAQMIENAEARLEMGVRARRRQIENFSLTATQQGVFRVFDEVAAR